MSGKLIGHQYRHHPFRERLRIKYSNKASNSQHEPDVLIRTHMVLHSPEKEERRLHSLPTSLQPKKVSQYVTGKDGPL